MTPISKIVAYTVSTVFDLRTGPPDYKNGLYLLRPTKEKIMKPQNTWANEIAKRRMVVKTIYRRVKLDEWVKPVVRVEVKR